MLTEDKLADLPIPVLGVNSFSSLPSLLETVDWAGIPATPDMLTLRSHSVYSSVYMRSRIEG